MIDVLGLLRSLLIADNRHKQKSGAAEYAARLKREAQERKKHIEELVVRHERDRALRRANDN
jgi:hypothetical protein